MFFKVDYCVLLLFLQTEKQISPSITVCSSAKKGEEELLGSVLYIKPRLLKCMCEIWVAEIL